MIPTMILFLVLAAEVSAGEALRFQQSGFSADASGWTVWSDRAEM
jgi:hypothetical protein